jgi:hypothetical protein
MILRFLWFALMIVSIGAIFFALAKIFNLIITFIERKMK